MHNVIWCLCPKGYSVTQINREFWNVFWTTGVVEALVGLTHGHSQVACSVFNPMTTLKNWKEHTHIHTLSSVRFSQKSSNIKNCLSTENVHKAAQRDNSVQWTSVYESLPMKRDELFFHIVTNDQTWISTITNRNNKCIEAIWVHQNPLEFDQSSYSSRKEWLRFGWFY